MKKFRITALLLTAMLAATATVGCGKKNKTNTNDDIIFAENDSQISPVDISSIGKNNVSVALSEEANENETLFKLNNVYVTDVLSDGVKFVYFDVTIHNSTGTEYTLSTLNNFYLESNGEKIYSSVRTQLYARNNFKEGVFAIDPFTVPAYGDFSGVIGGIIVNEDCNEFTVGFYPTKQDINDKETVITVNVTPDSIKNASELLK